jgi:hypothetical protein
MKALFIALFILSGYGAVAQVNTGGCGTVTPQSEVEKIYDFVQHNPATYAKTTAGILDSIPLSIHIVGNDAGGGYYQLSELFPLICQLNTRYAPVNFHFYIQWPIEYINSSAYYAHDFGVGGTMMYQHNVANTANVYFVQDPAGNCGYYSYYGDAVAIGKNCAGNNSTTLTHELGHYFSLPHTFNGWENGNVPSNPEAVRRSGAGTNCNSAGDGFCDTYADYISTRWSCPGPVNKTDIYGDPYHLDSSMYMSYSADPCQSRFSPQQIARMQYNLHSSRQSFTGAINPRPVALDSARVIYPFDTLFANGKKATWHRVPGADYYYVRLSYPLAPGLALQGTLTKDTFMNITYNFDDGDVFLLDVQPVNAHDVCLGHGITKSFTYADRYGNLGLGNAAAQPGVLKVYPNPVKAGGELRVSFGSLPTGNYSLSLSSVAGQQVLRQDYFWSGGNGELKLGTRDLSEGIYFLRWASAAGEGVVRVKVGL